MRSDKRTSQDDLLLLHKLEGGIQQDEEGYYEMPLPFKSRPQLPDNKRLAIIRLGHLKRKMDRDERYHHHYSKFMSEVIENGDAERVVSEPDVRQRDKSMSVKYQLMTSDAREQLQVCKATFIGVLG